MHCGALKAIEQQRDNLAMERMRNNLAVSGANYLAKIMPERVRPQLSPSPTAPDKS